MRVLSTIYRKILFLGDRIISILRIVHLRLKYPGISIDFKTYIGANCTLVCETESSLVIRSSTISNGTFIVSGSNSKIIIDNSFVGRNAVIIAKKGVVISANCQIAEMVVIRDQDHNFGDDLVPVAKQGFTSNPILIEENVWIGSKATILRGVTLGRNSVIGANSLVNKDIAPNTVNAGVPSKVIK